MSTNIPGAALAAALSYAARGWHVFVLSPSKSPLKNCTACTADGHSDTAEAMENCGCLTCHGFYAATTDPDRLTEMVRRHPRGMLAIRTGAISGLAVVDVDIKEWDADRYWPAPTDPAWRTGTRQPAGGHGHERLVCCGGHFGGLASFDGQNRDKLAAVEETSGNVLPFATASTAHSASGHSATT